MAETFFTFTDENLFIEIHNMVKEYLKNIEVNFEFTW